MKSEWADYAAVQALCGEPIRKRAHATCQGTFGHSPQPAEPLWTDPGIKSGISVRELISTLKKKSAGGE